MSTALLLAYDPDQPSFRHRMRSLIAPLEAAGWQVRVERFPSGRYGLRTWERRELLRWADVTVLHQIKLSAPEARLVAALTRRRVFDIDDAIYVRKPRRLGDPVHDSIWRRRKFAATCRWVDVVAAGNDVLAGVARHTARGIALLPTSIDTASYRTAVAASGKPTIDTASYRTAAAASGKPTIDTASYRTAAAASGKPTIVWIGSPENLIYLDLVRPALARLAERHRTLRLRIVCSRFPDWPEINVERIAWSAATEAESLATADIGIMPLTDDEWARGKCAFKLLQYMAASLPCVASPVGANTEAVIDGVTGFHAGNTEEWQRNLERLVESAPLCQQFGAAGRAHVERRYALRTYQADYVALFERLAAH